MGESTPAAQSQRTTAFVQRLREFGWIEGRTVAIEYRWGEGHSERFAEIAAEFVRLKVDVIATPATPPTALLQSGRRRSSCLGWSTIRKKHALGPRPDGWVPVFPRYKREAFARRSCSNKKIERDDDSKKSHPAFVSG
jgi:hypothetical protein